MKQVEEVIGRDLGAHIGKVIIMSCDGKVVGRIVKVEDGLLTFEWLCGHRQGVQSTVRFHQGCMVRVFGEDAEVSALLE